MKSYFSLEKNFNDISLNFKQTFHHVPSKKVDVSSLIRNRVENEEQISDFDLEILRIIKKLSFVTKEQVSKLLNKNEDLIERKLQKLVRNKLINSFMLSSIKFASKDEIPEDINYIYTMDYAGSEILNHFVEKDFQEWQCKDACLNPLDISKILVSNEFYIKVKDRTKEKLDQFIINPEYPLDKYMITSDFEMQIRGEDGDRIFLGEVITESWDRYKVIKMLEKIENFISTEAYKKVYGQNKSEPIVLFICSDEDALSDISDIIENLFVKIKIYRLTTIKRLENDLGEAGVFIKYDRISGGLKTTVLKLFKKNE